MYPDIKLMSYHHANKFTVRQLRPNKRKKNTITLHCNTDSIHLFHSSRYNPHHVLHRLLPPPKDTGHMLRQRAHNLTLPSDVSLTSKQNFIPRMLFARWYGLNSITNECMDFIIGLYWSLSLMCQCVCVCVFSRVTQLRVHERITYLLIYQWTIWIAINP